MTVIVLTEPHQVKLKRRYFKSETGTLISHHGKITRDELVLVPTPAATATHRPVPHHEIVEALVETLSFRQIGVIQEEYAVSNDGMKMFGVLDCELSASLLNLEWRELLGSVCRPTGPGGQTDDYSRFAGAQRHVGTSSPAI